MTKSKKHILQASDKLDKSINSIVQNETDDSADLFLYGGVGEDDRIDGDLVAEEIRRLDEKGVKVINEHINSGGGGVFNGLSIVSANLAAEADIRTYNEGVAGSMGGILLLTGDRVFMNDYSTLMLHEPSIGFETIETTEDEKTKNALIAIRDSLSKIIQNRSGKKKAEVDKILNEETWYNAKQAKKEGFIDEVISTKKKKKTNKINVKANLNKKSEDGSIWEVCLINSGYASTSTGQVNLPKDILSNNKSKFEKINVFAHSFGLTPDGKFNLLHKPIGTDTSKLTMNLVGWVQDVKEENKGAEIKFVADFHVMHPVVRETLLNIWNTDQSKMPDFSVDLDFGSDSTGTVKRVDKILSVDSFAMVTDGAFTDTGFLKLAASQKEAKQMKELLKAILAVIKAGKIKIDEDISKKTDDEAIEVIKNIIGVDVEDKALDEDTIKKIVEMTGIKEMKAKIEELAKNKDDPDPKPDDDPKPDNDPDPDKETEKEKEARLALEKANAEKKSLEDRMAAMEKAQNMKASDDIVTKLLALTKFDDYTKTMIQKRFEGKVATESEVKKVIDDTKEYLDKLLSTSNIMDTKIVVGDNNNRDKKKKLMELFLDDSLLGTKEYEGITYEDTYKRVQDMINDWAGHKQFNGSQTMQAATTATYTTLFQDVMNKQIRKEVGILKMQELISKLAEEVPIEYLDEQHIYDIGEFGLLSDVAEDGAYQAIAAPSDVEVTYTPKKIGNTFTISEEMLFTSGNRVTQLVKRYPKNLARSWKITLWKFVLDKITGCDASSGVNSQRIYDGYRLYHQGAHDNITASALSYTSFYERYVKMTDKTNLSGVAPAEYKPKTLLVPNNILPTAINVVKSPTYPSQTSNGVALTNVYSGLGVEPIGVPSYYLCDDTNNWYLIADKTTAPTLQVGYFQNKRVPELYVQNDPTQGVTFSNDRWAWKVKGRFGAAVLQWRSFQGGIVA